MDAPEADKGYEAATSRTDAGQDLDRSGVQPEGDQSGCYGNDDRGDSGQQIKISPPDSGRSALSHDDHRPNRDQDYGGLEDESARRGTVRPPPSSAKHV